MSSPYLDWLLIFMVLPTVVLFTFRFNQLWPYRQVILTITVAALLIGLPWDYLAAKNQIWGWDDACCSLPQVNGLPFEEILFITFAGLFISGFTITLRQLTSEK